MHLSTATAFLTCYLLITLLPRIFFRQDGKFNLMWFVAAAPYFFGALGIVTTYLDLVPTLLDTNSAIYKTAEILSIPLALGAFGLTCLTLGTHRIPLALWHQENDAPRSIVTYGAYARIRHPFYASFLTALVGTVLAAPNVISIFALIYGFLIMNRTAAREEERLSASEFGKEYTEYMKKTGRFIPKF
jgi:protein-S-isoprenylcysteine O-methyltransferase Ste14